MNNSVQNNNETFKDLILYKDANGDVKVEVYLMNENLWLTQAKIAELFDVDRSVVTKHLKNIYCDGELVKD